MFETAAEICIKRRRYLRNDVKHFRYFTTDTFKWFDSNLPIFFVMTHVFVYNVVSHIFDRHRQFLRIAVHSKCIINNTLKNFKK